MAYKWDGPHEWLEERAKKWDAAQLYQELMTLALRLDADAIQDEYQTEMNRDGYFARLEG